MNKDKYKDKRIMNSREIHIPLNILFASRDHDNITESKDKGIDITDQLKAIEVMNTLRRNNPKLYSEIVRTGKMDILLNDFVRIMKTNGGQSNNE